MKNWKENKKCRECKDVGALHFDESGNCTLSQCSREGTKCYSCGIRDNLIKIHRNNIKNPNLSAIWGLDDKEYIHLCEKCIISAKEEVSEIRTFQAIGSFIGQRIHDSLYED